MSTPFSVPDVLVLAAGGILGEAWTTALLAGIEESQGVDFRRTESLVGTSAGAIVAARLSGGRRPAAAMAAHGGPVDVASERSNEERQERQPHLGWDRRLARAGRSRIAALTRAAGAPLAPAALATGARGGALLRSVLLARAPEGTRTLHHIVEELDRTGASFDGRLRVCSVDRASGRRVVFGAPGAPPAKVSEAVAASCAIPTLFRPVRIGGREYVDGGVWSVTNLDAATVSRDTEVLCLNPLGGLPGDAPLGALRAAFRVSEALELASLRRRGARVRVIVPDRASAVAMGMRLMDPRLRGEVARAGFRQGLGLTG